MKLFANPFTLKKRGVLGMNRRNVDYIGRFNARHHFPLVDNKLKTKQVAKEAGIAIVKLLDTVQFQAELKTLQQRLEGLEQFVVKPAQGSGGKGILVIAKRDHDRFEKPNGEQVTLREVQHHISNILSGLYSLAGKNDIAMIEQLVEFDPIFDGYSYEGVPDIRVVLYKGFPILSMLRCSTAQSDGKANLHQGAVGVGLEMKSGKALKAVLHDTPVTHHPDTKSDFSQLVVPHWEKILRLAASCYEMTEMGYLGVDIVIDKHLGPLILELNARPGLAIQIANDVGALPRLNAIDTLKRTYSVDERVAYAIEHFH